MKKRFFAYFWCFSSCCMMVASAGSLVFDFENSELDGWKVVEGSFQKLHTDRKDFHHNKGPYNKHGDWFLSTLETVSGQPSDTMRGVIESPVFTLDSPKIMLLVGGGKHAETYVALCTLDGKAHYFGRGESSQKMQNVTWDAEGLVGKKVFLRMVDDHVAGWGHITLDHVQCEGRVDAVATEAHRKARKSVLGKATPQVGPRQISATGIRHSFLTTGSWTAIVGEDNEVIWEVKDRSRDGTVLGNGNVLIAFAKDVREYTRQGEVVFQYKLAAGNKEISTAYRLQNGNTLVAELGSDPRLLEVTPEGKIAIEVSLKPETNNAHMQTRMARKLPNGNYLVPHLLAFAIKEYAPDGEVVNIIKTDLEELGGRKAENWPFTAIRLKNGHTVACLTHGNKVVEFDAKGNVVWSCSNETAGGLFKDPCGGQVLPNGNVVVAPHAERRATGVKLFEVNQEKQVVWKYIDPRNRSTHGIHILTTNGKPVKPVMK